MKAVAIRPAAGCLIQLLFVRQCSLLSIHRQYTEVLELRIFRRLCLQLYIVEKKEYTSGVRTRYLHHSNPVSYPSDQSATHQKREDLTYLM